MKSYLRTILYFLAVIAVTAFVTAAIVIGIYDKERTDVVVLPTEEYAELKELLVLDELMDKIEAEAFGEAPSREEMVTAAAEGIVAALDDPYAAYYTASEYEKYISNINGEYDGVGLLIGQPEDAGAMILDVYDDTPAAEAGVLARDIITAVEGEPVAGMLLDELAGAIDREVGESVTLTLLRGEESFDVTLTCAAVNLERVSSALFNQYTGYIRISMFTGNCATSFSEAIKDLTDRGMRSLVIDLRDNPGGSLAEVVSVADTLLGEGTIVTVRGKAQETGDVYTSNAKGVKVPIAVIVNENSASASEILAAAVQEFGAGVIVGTTTFGKGVVQTTGQLASNQGWLKLTTDAYYTPEGNNLDGTGVTPDIEIYLPEELNGLPVDEIPQDEDAQLWAALDYVRAMADELAGE